MFNSIKLATKFKRQHKDLLRTARRRLDDSMYYKSFYIDSKGEKRTCYIINEQGYDILTEHHENLSSYHKSKQKEAITS